MVLGARIIRGKETIKTNEFRKLIFRSSEAERGGSSRPKKEGIYILMASKSVYCTYTQPHVGLGVWSKYFFFHCRINLF